MRTRCAHCSRKRCEGGEEEEDGVADEVGGTDGRGRPPAEAGTRGAVARTHADGELGREGDEQDRRRQREERSRTLDDLRAREEDERERLSRMEREKQVLAREPIMAAEDFAYFQQQIPGVYFFLGVANEAEGWTDYVHTPTFRPDERAILTGVTAVASLLADFTSSDPLGAR